MRTVGFISAVAVAIILAGCAGGPEPASTSPVSVELLSSTAVSYLTPTRANNPFMPISGLLRGIEDEFAVVKVGLSLPETGQVSLDGSVVDESGTEVAILQSYDQMVRYWDIPDDIPQRDRQIRLETLQRYYPKGFSFGAKKGQSEYVIVFKGKNPLPRPATVTVTLALGDGAPQEFSFPLPPKVKDLLGR